MLSPERGRKCKAFLSVGHDEYWDLRQYESVKALIESGVNALFLSGNSVCWVSPFLAARGTAWVGGTRPQQWAASIHPGPKNNFVFNAATIFWAQGMSNPPGHMLPWSHASRPHGADERVQRITENLLRRSLGQ
jgi:hypothetical protein